MNRIYLVVLALLLSSCSSMSPEECKSVNWRDKGFEDAMQGESVRLSSHREACASVKVTPNRAQYMAGHAAGSRRFCNYESGLRFGKKGGHAGNICSAPGQSQKFFDGYRKGKRIYDVKSQISSKESELYGLDRKIRNARKKSNASEVDHLYREKELINSLISSLRRELMRIE